MSKLIDLIRKHRGSDTDDFLVVYFKHYAPGPYAHRGQPEDGGLVKATTQKVAHRGQRLLEQAPDELFEIFEARAITAAKAAGDRVVTITVPEGGGLVKATTQKVDGQFWKKNPDEMTDAELLVVIASDVLASGGHAATDPFRITDDELEALANLGAPSALRPGDGS
jgi:hypothetical protein